MPRAAGTRWNSMVCAVSRNDKNWLRAQPPSPRPQIEDAGFADVHSGTAPVASQIVTITATVPIATDSFTVDRTVPFQEVSKPLNTMPSNLHPFGNIKKPSSVEKLMMTAPSEVTAGRDRVAVEDTKDRDSIIPASTYEQPVGVWVPMEGIKRHFSPPRTLDTPSDNRIFLEYTIEKRLRKPVRVEIHNAKGVFTDECSRHEDCGKRFVCCLKQWCDLTSECAFGYFCLPSCELTKMTHLASSGAVGESFIDLIYD
ncbi:hypothetical protein Tcan_13008 [Toxocara canis]|uniref:Uncharacterized protein n=1 Tax=Toxocara canis TaxID=6265 RepID=A0A0B2V275_TOXCA|nr:hypothetical protein Tcan_13008 [Toxocara canis]